MQAPNDAFHNVQADISMIAPLVHVFLTVNRAINGMVHNAYALLTVSWYVHLDYNSMLHIKHVFLFKIAR